jgi:hypothetical protein
MASSPPVSDIDTAVRNQKEMKGFYFDLHKDLFDAVIEVIKS